MRRRVLSSRVVLSNKRRSDDDDLARDVIDIESDVHVAVI